MSTESGVGSESSPSLESFALSVFLILVLVFFIFLLSLLGTNLDRKIDD